MKVYGLAAGAVLLLFALAYAGWQSNVASRLRADYEAFTAKRRAVDAEAIKALGEVAAKDAAIRGLSQQIKDLTGKADAARARADQAEARAVAFASRAADLGAEIHRLEAQAAARAAIRGRPEAIRALADLGYPGIVQGAPAGGQKP